VTGSLRSFTTEHSWQQQAQAQRWQQSGIDVDTQSLRSEAPLN
jgi:hypothetical protein